MKILVLGGTLFAGRWVVTRLIQSGHEVTLLNRGRSDPTAFPSLELLRCERGREYDQLTGRRFDLVIDSSAYRATDVDVLLSLPRLAERYLLLSSITVYERCSPGMGEDCPLVEAASKGSLTAETLGYHKRACERRVAEVYGPQAIILRCGLLVGAGDVSSSLVARPLNFDQVSPRFPYWPLRAWDGGHIMVPACGHRPIQILDVRDLADWVCRLAECNGTGIYNAVGVQSTLDALLEACRVSGADYVRVDDWFLLDNAVLPFIELPFWIPAGSPRAAAYSLSNNKAIAARLTVRPLKDTVSATLEWALENRDRAVPPQSLVMTRKREERLLDAWDHASKRMPWTKFF